MISLKKTFLCTCMVTMLGVFLAPTVIKTMQKPSSGSSAQVPLLIGLDGDVEQVLDLPSKLEEELLGQGINPIFCYKGKWFNSKATYQMPPNTKPDVYLHLNGRSLCPLIDDSAVISNMQRLVEGSTTKSAIYIHLIPKMGAKNYAQTFGKIKDQKSEKSKYGKEKFQSGIFLGSWLTEKYDDVFLVMDNGKLVTDVMFQNFQMKQPTNIHRVQMDQLVNILRQVNQEVQRRAGVQQGGFYPGPGSRPAPQKPAPKFKPKSQQKPAPKFTQKPGSTQIRSKFAPTGKLQLVSGGLTVPSLVIPSVIAPIPRPSQSQPPQFIPQFQAPKKTTQQQQQFVPFGSQPTQPQFTVSTQKPLRIGLVGSLDSVEDFPKLLEQELVSRGLNPVFVNAEQEADIYIVLSHAYWPGETIMSWGEEMKRFAKRSTTKSAIFICLTSSMSIGNFISDVGKIRDAKCQKSKWGEDKFQSGIFLGNFLFEKFDDFFLPISSGCVATNVMHTCWDQKQPVNIYREQMDQLIQLLLKVNKEVQQRK